MIEFIRGTVSDLTPTSVVLETGGVGYFLNTSLNTSSRLKEGETAKLLVYESIREDSHDLFGFIDSFERELFLLLITVKGIGPSSARTMLSSYLPKDLARYIAEENTTALKGVKGVGARTAERIIVELKNKIGDLYAGISPVGAGATAAVDHKEEYEEAEKAFVALGYTPAQAKAVVAKLVKADPDMSVNEMVRQGLRLMN